jgi:uncharacterized SAM-binding protein YcdF (DUF218 family)
MRLPRGLVIASGSLGAAVLLVLFGFLAFVACLDRFERLPTRRADAIVALTGGSQRIGEAIDLLAQGYGSRLLITGVNERTSRDEIARLNPGQRRLFECCVDLDHRARNTIGNAIATRRWARDRGFRSLIVVTSNYHMPRTLLELAHALPGMHLVPYAVVPPTVAPAAWWQSAATARVVAWVRTRFEADPERSTAVWWLGGGEPIVVLAEPIAP